MEKQNDNEITAILREALGRRQRFERVEKIGKIVLAVAFAMVAAGTVLAIGHPLLIALLGIN